MIDFVGFEVVAAMNVQFSKNFGERYCESKLISVMQEDDRAGNLSTTLLKVINNHFGTLLSLKLTHELDIILLLLFL